MTRILSAFLAALPLAMLAGCNTGGYEDLADEINPDKPLGQDSRTFIGRSAAGSGVDLLTLTPLDATGKGAMVYARVTDSSTATKVNITRGSYRISGDSLVAGIRLEYANTYADNGSPGGSAGVTETKFETEKRQAWLFAGHVSAASVNIGGRTLKAVESVYDAVLSKSSTDWAVHFLRLYQLNIMMGHSHIKGFGGGGMLSYIGKTTTFDATREGTLSMNVAGLLPVTTAFTYTECSELSAMTLSGTMTNTSDMTGTGSLGGTVQFTVQGSSKTWSGSVGYGNVKIAHTLPSSGPYSLTIDGAAQEIPFDFSNPGKFRFSDFLPAQ